MILKVKKIPKGTLCLDALKGYKQSEVLACLVNGKHQDLRFALHQSADIVPISQADLYSLADCASSEAANKVAWGTASALVSIAAFHLFGKRVKHLQTAVDMDRGGFSTDLLILKLPNADGFKDWEQLYTDDAFIGRLSEEQLDALQKHAVELCKANDAFEKITLADTKALHDLDIPASEDGSFSLWKFQNVLFTCSKPIAQRPSQIKVLGLSASELVHHAATKRQCVTRVYGFGFAHPRMKSRWDTQLEQAKMRDHRVVGQVQGLFMTHPFSPGAPFFLPHGTRIIRRLQDFLRAKYRRFGFEEVMTPLVYKKELWEVSGHWANYQQDMFAVRGCCDPDSDASTGLKPMNCPAHCLIFDSIPRSSADLPLRLADFGALHRNEASGALTGLTRVRQFHQDDGHIFCRPDQIAQEISATLQMLAEVYKALSFPSYELSLSTRPKENFMGSESEWEEAENALKRSLDGTGRPWFVKEGDGAFYGPKIDIMVKDGLGRSHQTATIQLDFQLPSRFGLKYKLPGGGTATPVIVHRAVFGSIERVLAILMEHHSGRWPFWLNPRQIIICPTPGAAEYAESVYASLSDRLESQNLHIYLDIDRSEDNLSAMIKSAQKAQYSLMLVVGPQEAEQNTINVRTRTGQVLGQFSFDKMTSFIAEMQNNHKF
ncbi:hypothetical protein DSO57_1024638 [Entomophthora muscae]|uniref:Uncharacterized protein n=1 Tax=Entomophthora muscae TaxID=34485 RepID=A0ACC2SRI2_9FUNG|nr:hypothetical protein DSO57_1024638 [Entomophthora muscae]